MKCSTRNLALAAAALAAAVLVGCSSTGSEAAKSDKNTGGPTVTEKQAAAETPGGGANQPGTSERGAGIKGYVQDIDAAATKNDAFRRVLYTAKNLQLVLMSLKPGEEIGSEVHQHVDQFFRVEEGTGEAVINGVHTPIKAGYAVLIPAGATHNILNTGTAPLKLYTLYAPPNHRDGVVHPTRNDAEADNEHFGGKTTE